MFSVSAIFIPPAIGRGITSLRNGCGSTPITRKRNAFTSWPCAASPGKAKPPRAPRTRPPVFHGESGNGGYEPALLDGLRYSRRTSTIQRRIRSLVARERLTVAESYLKQNARHLPAPHQDIARSRIAAGWFFHGNDQKAFNLADRAARKSGRYAPFAPLVRGS